MADITNPDNPGSGYGTGNSGTGGSPAPTGDTTSGGDSSHRGYTNNYGGFFGDLGAWVRNGLGMAVDTLASGNTPSTASYSQDPWWQNYFQSRLGTVSANPYDSTVDNQARAEQERAATSLRRVAAGSRDTQAQRELAGANQTGQNAQMALASGQRGTGAGAQLAQAARGSQQVAMALPGQQMVLQRQQQLQAQQQLAQLYQQMAGQDTTSANNAANASLRSTALDDQMSQAMASQGWQDAMNGYNAAFGTGQANLGFANQGADLTTGTLGDIANAGAAALGTASGIDWSNGGTGDAFSSPSDWASYNPSTRSQSIAAGEGP